MKYSIYNNFDIASIPKETTALHLVRPISKKKAIALIEKLTQLKEITMASSTFNRMKKALKVFKEKNIPIKIDNSRGRAIEIPLEKISAAIEMHKDLRPLREIEETLGIPKSTAHYLIKYAKRKKIKSGKKITYLK